MTLLDTRNRFYADTEILAEPLDANFASIWGVVNGGITGDNIVGKSIGNGNLADNCIDTAKLAQLNVVHNQHIVNNTISGVDKIQARSIDGDRLMLGSVGSDIIAAGSIVGSKIANGTISPWSMTGLVGGVKLSTAQGTGANLGAWIGLGVSQFKFTYTPPITGYAKFDAVISVDRNTVETTSAQLHARLVSECNTYGKRTGWGYCFKDLHQGKSDQLHLTGVVHLQANELNTVYIEFLAYGEQVTISDMSYMSWVISGA